MATTADYHRALRVLFDEHRGRPAPPRARRLDPRLSRQRARGRAFLKLVNGDLEAAFGAVLDVVDPIEDDPRPAA